MEEFTLEFSGATIPYSKHSQVLQSPGSNRAFALSNHTLYEFEFNENNQPIIRTTQDKAYPFQDGAKLIYVETIDDEKTAIIVKVSQGIHIYVHSKDNVHLAVEDDQFHDALDWHKPENGIHFGHFYHDHKILGLMSSHGSSGTKFFAIFKDVLLAGDFPVYPLETNVGALETHSPNSGVRMLGKLNRNSKDYVLARNRDGISCFQFNEANGIDFSMKIPHAGGGALNGHRLFFTELTYQKYNEVVHFNSSGLFVYQYDSENYKFLLYNPFFSEAKGWTPRHIDTVRFFDIDKDGLTDMVFTGPRGLAAITYDQYSNSWNDLIVTSNLAPGMRHAQLMQVVTTSDNGDYIYVHIDDSIRWAKLVQHPLLPPKLVPLPGPSDKVLARSSTTPPQAASPKSFEPLSLLRDMNIWSVILNCIGLNTGKPKFLLPLINLPDLSLKLVMFYDATRTASDVLGVGWSMPLNLIVMDDQGSIFDEDTVYVIAFQDAMHSLKHLPMESNANVHTYTLPSRNGSPKFRAKFYTNEDRWVVDLGTGIKQTYGWTQSTKTGAVSKDIVWKNWHGAGFDSGDQQERSRMWYLAEVRDERDKAVLEFFYDTDTVTVESGSTYTKAVYINRSRDFQGNEIKFQYQEKEANEYRTYDLQDQEGNFNWEPVQTRYLTGYTFRTPSRGKQEVSFGYRTANGHRFLTEIRQAEDVIESPVAKFEYEIFSTGKCSLKNALLPYGVEVAFTYAAVGKSTRSKELQRLEVFADYKVTIGEGFVLVSYINGKPPGQVILRMFNRSMTEEMYTSHSNVRVTTKGRWPLLGEHASTLAYEVIQGDEYFGVVLFYAVSKRLCLFGREAESGNWLKKSECHEYGEEAVINAGRDFCLVANPGKIVELFEWKSTSTSGTWNRRTIIANAATVAISVHQSKFVTYDNLTLSLGYKTSNGTWIHKPLLKIDSCLSKTEATIKRFNLRTNDHKLIAAAFRNNVVKFNHNLVALKCLDINGHQLQSVVTLYTIDRLKKISDQQKFTINQDDLNTIVSSEEKGPDGNYFKFKYEIKPNGDIYIRLAGFRGPLLQRAHTEAQKSEVAQHMEKSINSPSKRFFLDLQNYLMSFSDKVLVLNNQKLTFGGATWHRTTLTDKERNRDSFSIPLGDKFTLDKANKTASIKLLQKSTRQTVAQLPVDLSDLRIFYPVYMATQTKGVPVRLMVFDDMTVRESLLSSSETLSPFSNPMMVITQEGGDASEKSKTLIFREQYGINKFLPNPVVREVAVYFDSDRKKRVTGYEYDAENGELEGSNVVYSKCSVIPANEKYSYGWLVQSLTEDNTSTAYDSRGQPVRYMPVKKKQPHEEEEEEAFRRATTIYDKSGRLEIAQCAPFRPANEDVGYYGFEDYESKIIGKSNQWQFKASNVIRNGFALTGKNYLHEQTEPIEGVFQPLDQNAEYIASSWIRLQNVTTVPQIGEVTPYLKAIVLTTTGQDVISLLSEVKFRIDDWIYLELIVDIPFAKASVKNDLQDNLKIAIRVGPTSITPIDIDHVRFAPLISDFNVNIFDETTNSNTAVITPSGSIHRRIYDVYNSVVAKINEQNQIDELTVYTKAGAMSKTPRCTVNVQPEMGFYEQFSPFSFVNRWKVSTTSPWRIASYQLEHNGGQSNSLELSTLYDWWICFIHYKRFSGVVKKY